MLSALYGEDMQAVMSEMSITVPMLARRPIHSVFSRAVHFPRETAAKPITQASTHSIAFSEKKLCPTTLTGKTSAGKHQLSQIQRRYSNSRSESLNYSTRKMSNLAERSRARATFLYPSHRHSPHTVESALTDLVTP